MFVAGALAFAAACAQGIERYYVGADEDIRDVVSGTWDWSKVDDVCQSDMTTFSFSDADDTMILTHPMPIVAFDGLMHDTFTYDILEASRNHIRGAIRGETRLTREGVPVVWDLVLTSRHSFCWHRTDWDRESCTDELVRCSD
jgi:hypothetical protein